MRHSAALLALVLALAVSPGARADEILLNNGNVLEGEIVKETPDEVVIKTEFGEMKVRRAQIKSIRRITLPSAGTKPAEPPAPAFDPKSVAVPGTGVRLPAFPAEWTPMANPGEKALGFLKNPARSILVRAILADDRRGATLEDYFRMTLGSNQATPVRDAKFRHGGFEARRVQFRSAKYPGTLFEGYAIDTETTLVYALLQCPESAFGPEGEFFWRQMEGMRLRVPAPAGGERDRAEMTLGSPGSQAAFLGPEGPWMHVQDEMNPVQPMAAFSQGGSRACVVFTMPWDGGGEILRENSAAFLGRFGPVAGAGEIRNPKPYAASGRFELAGDFRAKARDQAS
ncbi:MAG: hypothetical protein MUC63_05850, partial [Planctomycetes bacterium]|nr:hypothetical protein [Planctomycetota bacterium]